VPNTKWKLKNIGYGWVLGETLISGIGQGYFQTTPIQLCLMMAQLANGGYEIKPRIVDDKYALQSIVDAWREEFTNKNNIFGSRFSNLKKLYRNKENIKFVLDALYGATNEPMGTSYRSRLTKEEFIFAGKTGTSQKYGNKNENLNTFISVFPSQDPKYALLVMLENPQVATDLIYNYRGMQIKGTRNEAGWNSVYIAGKIIKKIGPILAIKNKEFYNKHVAKKLN